MLSILAVLAAPGHCQVAAGLGMWMATRHPGVRRWRVEPAATPLEGVFPYPSTSAPSISLALAMAAYA
jgi:hypothetical protein